MNRMTGKMLVFVSVMGLIVTGCAGYHLVPEHQTGDVTQAGAISKQLSGTVITAYHAAREERPYEAPRHFTCISVIVENQREEPINIGFDNFALLLENKRQLKPQPPTHVSDTIYPVRRERVVVGLGVGFGSSDVPWCADTRVGFYDRTTDIFVDAFQPGDIEPAASSKGVLYFNRIPKGTRKVTLRFRLGDEYADLPYEVRR